MAGDLGLRIRQIYLRLSVTDRCNFRCQYCLPEQSTASPTRTPFASDGELIALARQLHAAYPIYKLRVTGGEPLLRPRLDRFIGNLQAALPDTELALTTNGVLLKRQAAALYAAGLRSLNISIDTLDEAGCRDLTRGGKLSAVLAGIAAARAAGFRKLKLNAVLLRTVNGQQIPDLVQYAASIGAEMRFIELMPFGEGAALHETEYLSSPDALEQLSRVYSYLGKTNDSPTSERHRFRVAGEEIVVGFIRTMSEPFCDTCDRIRLDSRGRLFPCLRSDSGADLLTPYRWGEENTVSTLIRETIRNKATPSTTWPTRPMAAIGG